MRILICGDSYYDFDERYNGLHWADNLTGHEVYRLARGGASNFSIYQQVKFSKYFSPDIVLVTFTAFPRVEFLRDEQVVDKEFTKKLLSNDDLNERMWFYRNTVYQTIDHALPNYNDTIFKKWLSYYIEPYEATRNSIYIKSALDLLSDNKVKYYYTLGGAVIDDDIDLSKHQTQELLPNSHQHPEKFSDPYFHIMDAEWHKKHTELVMELCQ